MNQRRKVLAVIPIVPLALTGRAALAQPARLDEKDPQAVSLGYRHDATKVDRAKFPKYAPGQICDNCQLHSGKGEWVNCSIFPNKQVAAKGWCSAWIKKA